MIIAIDGPAASGKSTTAKKVAEKLNFLHLDTGAMYRAVTLFFLNQNVQLSNQRNIRDALDRISIEFDRNNRPLLNGEDVTNAIRSTRISNAVSEVSAVETVRKKMVQIQQEIGKNRNVVAEGRDIGTVVFPNAEFKFFIVADVTERARRRLNELKRKQTGIELDDIVRELKERDKKDSTRKISPLKKADDAIVIDTTNLSIDEQVDKIINIISTKCEIKGVQLNE